MLHERQATSFVRLVAVALAERGVSGLNIHCVSDGQRSLREVVEALGHVLHRSEHVWAAKASWPGFDDEEPAVGLHEHDAEFVGALRIQR